MVGDIGEDVVAQPRPRRRVGSRPVEYGQVAECGRFAVHHAEPAAMDGFAQEAHGSEMAFGEAADGLGEGDGLGQPGFEGARVGQFFVAWAGPVAEGIHEAECRAAGDELETIHGINVTCIIGVAMSVVS